MNIEEIKYKISNSAFNKQYYSVTLTLQRVISGMFLYTGVDGKDIESMSDENNIPLNKIFQAVPDFQRDNDKWSEEMQVSFIENVLCGYRTDIMLFEISDTGVCNCMILDGLQRITAFYRFLSDEIKVFGKYYSELKQYPQICGRMKCQITLKVYSFDTKNDAIDFYVSMNRNITHSKEDIDKALSFKEVNNG